MRVMIRLVWIVSVSCFCYPAVFVAAAYEDGQYAGIEALYIATNGEQWTESSGWRNATLGVCGWYGITCQEEGGDGNNNVTGIFLAGNGLVGDLSDATSALSEVVSLQDIDLSDNQLSGPVPLSLGLLPELEVLDLSGNELSSFPSAWGSGASALRYLSVQDNDISGSLPTAWLEVNDTSSHPMVHLLSESLWLPELRTLLLRKNTINTTAYATLQTIAGLKSLQTFDVGEAALTGSMEDALTLHYCVGSSGDAAGCAGSETGVAGPSLRVLALDGNGLAGQLPPIVDADGNQRRVMEVLDVSDNDGISGSIPENYSELFMLFADGTGLSDSVLPSFVQKQEAQEYAYGTFRTYYYYYYNESMYSSSDSDSPYSYVCPAFDGVAGESFVAVTMDPAYDGYSLCTCGNGYGGSGANCSECPLGWYASAKDDDGHESVLSGVCQACPANSTTLQSGRWKARQCVCSTNFYDQLGGLGESGPSCVQCPSRARTVTVGATHVTSCECEPGYLLHASTNACEACDAGTYKSAYGNDAGLCLPCPAGSYSDTIGAASSSACNPCPRGYYGASSGGSSVANCSACPEGTYGTSSGLTSESLCAACWAGYYSPTLAATSALTCIECPSNYSQPEYGAGSWLDCIVCSDGQVAESGSAECYSEVAEDGTLVGLYLLIAGIFLVMFTLAYVFLQKHCRGGVPVTDKVHMTLNEEMQAFIVGQQFWISLFSGVEIMDLMSDLGAYASLLYTAALTGAMKIVYTIVVAFALMASLHGVHTRAIIILDMQEERTVGLAITGNNMLYYEKQYNIMQIMTQKRTCRRHVPFDRGNKYLSHHIGVQRLISLNSMRIIIAIFEDVPFLGLNLYLLMQQPFLSKNLVFMVSFVLSIFVLGYKMTLLEKHARLQIRKWNLEARMDTDTMLNKKAARGRRFSWTCQQCQQEGKTPASDILKQQQREREHDMLLGETGSSAITATTSAASAINTTEKTRTALSGLRTRLRGSGSAKGNKSGHGGGRGGEGGRGRGRGGRGGIAAPTTGTPGGPGAAYIPADRDDEYVVTPVESSPVSLASDKTTPRAHVLAQPSATTAVTKNRNKNKVTNKISITTPTTNNGNRNNNENGNHKMPDDHIDIDNSSNSQESIRYLSSKAKSERGLMMRSASSLFRRHVRGQKYKHKISPVEMGQGSSEREGEERGGEIHAVRGKDDDGSDGSVARDWEGIKDSLLGRDRGGGAMMMLSDTKSSQSPSLGGVATRGVETGGRTPTREGSGSRRRGVD